MRCISLIPSGLNYFVLKIIFLSDEGGGEDEVQMRNHGDQTPDVSPLRGNTGPQSSTPVGQNIMSMEDDDTSDQELVRLHYLT